MEPVENEKITELKSEITKRLVAFLDKQKRGSQITIIRVARRTGFDPFFIRQVLNGKPVPFSMVWEILSAFNCPSVYVEDFIGEIKEFSDAYKETHGIEPQFPPGFQELFAKKTPQPPQPRV